MKKKALYVGSFDPFTLGHENIAKKAEELFDLTIAVASNIHKKSLFSAKERQEMIKQCFPGNVVIIEGLVADYLKEHQIPYLVRGLRSAFDMENELSLADINQDLCGVETVYLLSDPAVRHIHSKHIQELLHFKQDISNYVPKQIADSL